MMARACVLSCLLLVVASSMVDSYSQVVIAGSGANHDDGPKIFKAMNMDLIYPKTFNSSENVISTTQTPAVMTESVESSSFTTGNQFTPERSSSQISGPTLPPDQDQYQQSPSASEQAAVIPANHYPPTFVIPDNHADESVEREATLPPPATGRAVDYRPAYPFSQLLTPTSKGYTRPSMQPYPMRSPPVSRPSSSSTAHRVIYPSYQAPRIPSRAEIDKLSGKGKLSDRFTPSEAVASQMFRQNQNRNPKPSISRPIGQSSKKVTSFVPAKDLYSFPPNLMSRYPSPSEIKQASPSDAVTSYLPPPAGPSDGSKFVGPVNPDLLLGDMKSDNGGKGSSSGGYHYDPPADSVKDNGGGYTYNPPQPPLGPNLSSGDQGAPPPPPPPPAPPMDNGEMQEMGPPAPDADNGDMDDGAPPPPDHDHDHGHDHHYDHDHVHDHDHGIIGGYEEDKEYPTPPPGYLEEHDHDHDHDHGHDHYHPHHHPDIDFAHGPYFHGPPHDYDHYDHPDIIYDDYHHDHHHDHIIEHHPLPETTTEVIPPPPPAPEQPRVKKYSYFYIGRKLWYIPLYFTVWFSFYVLWLILKSIARHKVNLPNHYVQRRSLEDLGHREAREAIDKLTAKVMEGIEKFKLRYIG